MIKETLCEHCVFKKQDVSGKQVGCELNRLDKFQSTMKDGFYVIDGYCSTCRNIYWKAGYNYQTTHEMVEAVKKETLTTYDVIIPCDEHTTEAQLRYTINSIELMKYKPTKVFIVYEASRNLSHIIDGLDSRYELVIALKSPEQSIIDVMKKVKSAYLVFTFSGGTIDEAVMESYDVAMNVDLKPKATYSSDKFFVCPTFLYKHFMYEKDPFRKIYEYVAKPTAH